MKHHCKKRLEDFFRTGKANGFRKLFRNWLSADGFGICRPCRTVKNARNFAPAHKQATEAVQSAEPESGSIARKSPGNIDLYLLFKKRDGKALSDKTAEVKPVSRKSVQK